MLELNRQILFFLSALGAFNGILLSVYLITVRHRNSAYIFLSILLLAISVRVGKSVLFYFSPDLSKAILQVGLSACFFIGPLLYFYCADSSKKLNKQRVNWKLHLTILTAIPLIFGFIYPYEAHPVLWGVYAYKLVNWLWFIYIILALPYVIPKIRKMKSSVKQLDRDDLLLLNVYFGVFIIWFAYISSSYTSYIVGALSFSFSLYLSLLLFIWQLKSIKEEKYLNKKIDTDTAKALFDQLQQLMKSDKVYCDATLTLAKLARKMSIPPPQLSQLLNDNFQKPFATFINEHRIEEAKALLLSSKNLNMENVADLCGYNSLSTFYGAFNKIEQIPPAKFRKLHS